MNQIAAKELKNLINDKSKDFQVIDVRSRLEWEDGHIEDPRVINIDINNLIFNSSQVSKEKDIYIICESGGRSSLANMFLKTKGYKSFDVTGGMSEFRKLAS
jgi:rhodanese-related sulfurtransferase